MCLERRKKVNTQLKKIYILQRKLQKVHDKKRQNKELERKMKRWNTWGKIDGKI